MNTETSPVTIITGATDGIGLALARRWRTQDRRLVLIGRQPFEQTALADDFPAKSYCRVDLAESNCTDTVVRWLDSAGITQIDILIHNAAVGYYGHTAGQSPETIRQINAVNLFAPVALTHTLLPLITRPGGKVAFISSVVSSLPCPEYAVYGASKAALDGFALNLRLELQGQIHVQVIRPGATRSGMHAKSGLSPKKIDWRKFPPTEEVAAQIERAISTRRNTVTLGFNNRLAQFAGRYFGGLFDAVMRRRYR